MNFKSAASMVLVLSLFWGCKNSTKDQGNQTSQPGQEQPGQQQPGQGQPGQGQMMQQAEDVSDEELTQFMSAMENMQIINQSAQQEMVGAVQKEGMEVERFSEIMQSEQDPNQEANATNEEMEQYAAVNKSIEEVQIRAQEEMEEKIVESGLTLDRYQEIGAIVQSSPELQQKLQSMQPSAE